MRKELALKTGKSMLRWLLLALLFTGVTTQSFAEPKSVYRIEEVISAQDFPYKQNTYVQRFYHKRVVTPLLYHCKNLQSKHLSLHSQILGKLTQCAVSNAPETLQLIRKASGQLPENMSLSLEDDFIFYMLKEHV